MSGTRSPASPRRSTLLLVVTVLCLVWGSTWLVIQEGLTDLRFSFEDLGIDADTYAVYEGSIGSWYSHGGPACALAPTRAGGRGELLVTPGADDVYYLVTATGSCAEGPAGADSLLRPRDPLLLGCAP